jgi:hypothetical protein
VQRQVTGRRLRQGKRIGEADGAWRGGQCGFGRRIGQQVGWRNRQEEEEQAPGDPAEAPEQLPCPVRLG